AIGDINGDGKPDVVAAQGNGNANVFLNTTAPGATSFTFAPSQQFSAGFSSVRQVRLGDFNGDGKLDLVFVTHSLSGVVSVLLNSTTPGSTTASFGSAATFATNTLPYGVAIGDLNG